MIIKKQLALSTLILFLGTPLFAGTSAYDCKMTSNGNRVCGPEDKTPTTKSSDSSFFSFWNSDQPEETKTTSTAPIKKHETKNTDEQLNNDSTPIIKNKAIK